jgi:antitoxin YefM
MTTLPVADARANLSKLIDEASTTHERIEITKNGRRAAVLMGADDYDSMRETISALSDSELMTAHLTGMRELAAGDFLDGEAVARLLDESGRRGGDE